MWRQAMNEKITFKELVRHVAEKTGQNEKNTDDAIHYIAGTIEDALGEGEKVPVAGFGKFELRWMDERKGRNPQSGEEITIPGQNRVFFKPFKALRERVNQPFEHLQSKPAVPSGSPGTPNTIDTTPSASVPDPASEHKHSSSNDNRETDTIEDLLYERPSPVQTHPTTGSLTSTKNHYADTEPSETVDELLIERDRNFLIDLRNTGIKPRPDHPESVAEPEGKSRHLFRFGAIAAVALITAVVVIYLAAEFSQDRDTENSQAGISAVQPVPEDLPPDNSRSPVESTDSQNSADSPAAADRGQPQVPESHTIESGETLWSISGELYNDPFFWPAIYRENLENLESPNEIYSGSDINLPDLPQSGTLSETERRTVALGYISVYDWMSSNQPGSEKFVLWAAGVYSADVLEEVSDRVNQDDLSFAIQN